MAKKVGGICRSDVPETAAIKYWAAAEGGGGGYLASRLAGSTY